MTHRPSSGRRHEDLSATQILSITHMVALLLILLSAVLFKHSIGDSESTTAWLFLGQGVLVALIGRRLCRNKLVILARRRGLNEADAKAYAKGQMLQLTAPGKPRRVGEGSPRARRVL